MRGVSDERHAQQRLAALPHGRRVIHPRHFVGQVRQEMNEAAIEALPVAAVAHLEDDDGNPVFMFGYSTWGGPDTFGGSA